MLRAGNKKHPLANESGVNNPIKFAAKKLPRTVKYWWIGLLTAIALWIVVVFVFNHERFNYLNITPEHERKNTNFSVHNCGYDSDQDGIGDNCERCPFDPNKLVPLQCGCSISEIDTDFDGVVDCLDDCPYDPLKTLVGQCGCNYSDKDSDNDGTADCIDRCPLDAARVHPVPGCGCQNIESIIQTSTSPETPNAFFVDSDHDGIADCFDFCPMDAEKLKRPCARTDEEYSRYDDEEEDLLRTLFDGNLRKNRKALEEMRRFPLLLKTIKEQGPLSADESSIDRKVFEQCYEDNNYFRMLSDPLCAFLWMRLTMHSDIRGMDKVLRVVTRGEELEGILEENKELKLAQSGGAKLVHSDSKHYSYWKPCYGNTGSMEDYRGEVVSFFMDRILAIHRTPPVFPRFFSSAKLLSWALDLQNKKDNPDPEAISKILSTIKRCGAARDRNRKDTKQQRKDKVLMDEILKSVQTDSDLEFLNQMDGVEGATVGWMNFPLKELGFSIKYPQARFDKFLLRYDVLHSNETRAYYDRFFRVNSFSPPNKLFYPLQNAMANIFAIVTGDLMKFDHNFFIALNRNASSIYGPLVYLDNDRASWEYSAQAFYRVRHTSAMSKLCRFPEEVSRRLHLLSARFRHPNSTIPTLGELVMDAVSVFNDSRHYPFLSQEMADIIDSNVHLIMKIFANCKLNNGMKIMFIPEPWAREWDYNLINILSTTNIGETKRNSIYKPEIENFFPGIWGLYYDMPSWNRLFDVEINND